MKKLFLSATLALCTTASFAAEPSAKMDEFLEASVMGWANDPVVIDAVRAQNVAHAALSQSDVEALDQKWRAEVGAAATPTISSIVDNAASEFLRQHVADMKGRITEVIVMDALGLNVAASGTTSDYWQGDEAKHAETFGVGPDARHYSDIEKDGSTGTYQAQASFTLVDPDTGEPIGAMTVGINAEALH